MNYKYTLKRDPKLEEKAQQHPYLFGPFSYNKTNSFLSGTGVFFEDQPLSSRQGKVCLSLISSYLELFKIVMTSDSIFSYRGTRRAEYVWFQRRHEFYLLDAEAELQVHNPIKVGSQVILGDRIIKSEDARSDKLMPQYIPRIVEFAETKYAWQAMQIFGFNKLSRVSLTIKFDSNSINTRRDY